MATTFDRHEFIRAMRGKPGLPSETLEAMAEALHAQYRAGVTPKTKQSYWETPRALAIIVGATAAVFSVLAGIAGYQFGSRPQQAPQIIFQPGAIQLQAPPSPAPASPPR